MFSFRIKRRGRLYRITVLPGLGRRRTSLKATEKQSTGSNETKREKRFQRLRLGLLTFRPERLNDSQVTCSHSRETCSASERTAWPIF